MIKVNLLPEKKKKKAKPLPAFLISLVLITVVTLAVLGYVVYFFNSRIEDRKRTVQVNDQRIKELEKKIKAVEDYEARNALFQKRKEIIEQLSRNRTIPVKVLDELSLRLPSGVWLNAFDIKGANISLDCTAFTNTDVVNYVNNLKNSKLFGDVFLQQSVQAQIANYTVYNFRLTLRVKI